MVSKVGNPSTNGSLHKRIFPPIHFAPITYSLIFNLPNPQLMIGHITLIIAHHHPVFQAILHHILHSCAGICVLAKVDTAKELHKKTKELQPDVVLVGLSLPGMGKVAAWEKLVAHSDKTKVVVSWPHADADKLKSMMHLSFAGYIAGDAPPVDYIYAVKQAAQGKESYCTQTQKLRASSNEAATFAKNLGGAWPRMLYCISMNYSNKEMAEATGLKESTIKSYRKKLKNITGYRSAAALEIMVNARPDEHRSDGAKSKKPKAKG